MRELNIIDNAETFYRDWLICSIYEKNSQSENWNSVLELQKHCEMSNMKSPNFQNPMLLGHVILVVSGDKREINLFLSRRSSTPCVDPRTSSPGSSSYSSHFYTLSTVRRFRIFLVIEKYSLRKFLWEGRAGPGESQDHRPGQNGVLLLHLQPGGVGHRHCQLPRHLL